ENPGEQRRLDGEPQPRQQHVEIVAGPHRIRLEEDVPVPVIVHVALSDGSRSDPRARSAPLPLAGRGWGWGYHAKSLRDVPPPYPSPARGEGTHRRCGTRSRLMLTSPCRNPGPANPTAWRTRPSARARSAC